MKKYYFVTITSDTGKYYNDVIDVDLVKYLKHLELTGYRNPVITFAIEVTKKEWIEFNK